MKTVTKLKRENRKRLKTTTKKLKTKTKMPKQQNLSLNESASIKSINQINQSNVDLYSALSKHL